MTKLCMRWEFLFVWVVQALTMTFSSLEVILLVVEKAFHLA